jgi:hypothetical protein
MLALFAVAASFFNRIAIFFEDTATADIIDAMEAGLGTAQTNIMGVLGSVLPLIMGIIAIIIAVQFGIKFFRRFVK